MGRVRRSVLRVATAISRARFARLGRASTFICQGAALVAVSGRGDNNSVRIGVGSSLRNCRLVVIGNGNEIIIGENCHLPNCTLWLEGNDCVISIGDDAAFEPGAKIAAVESGSRITIGHDALISDNVEFRTSDSHAIWDKTQRINPPADITIGNHVWIGNGVLLLKGSSVADGSVIGARSLVTSALDAPKNSILAGTPAKVIREGIRWSRQIQSDTEST